MLWLRGVPAHQAVLPECPDVPDSRDGILRRLREVKDVETITRRAPVLPEVRRGGKVVDPASLLRHENRHDERLTGLPRRNNPRRSG